MTSAPGRPATISAWAFSTLPEAWLIEATVLTGFWALQFAAVFAVRRRFRRAVRIANSDDDSQS